MKSGGFFLNAALTHLYRGGQRNLVAFFCVAFGVMSLVAMATLAHSIEKMLVLEPYELIGGDLTLDRVGEDFISTAEEAGLEALQASGQISNYTMMDYTTSLSFRLPDSGELFFPSIGMGVDSGKYPLAGNLTISAPQDAKIEDLLEMPGDVIITYDLALSYKLNVGDIIILSNLDYGKPLTATIRGIASDTPNHQGSKIYYSHETSFSLTGMPRTANTVLVNAADPEAAAKMLEESGWRVFTAQHLADAAAVSEGTIAMALNDIGLLGLLVSGIGIANTMQVLLRRRRKEVAVWKSIGYTARQIQSMFVTEAGLLGFSGSLVGAMLGVLLSYALVGLFARITTVLIRWSFSPVEAVSGVVIGTMTTIIFAMWAIVSTSRVRPLALLRNEDLEVSQIPLAQAILLSVFLAIPFLAIAVWVLRSFLVGMLVLFGTLLALAGIGFGLWLLARLAMALMPTRHWAVGKIAQRNLRRRASATQVISMIALFIGVMMLGIGAVITQSGQQVMGTLNETNGLENLAIYASPQDEEAILQELAFRGLTTYSTGHLYQVGQILAPTVTNNPLNPTLMGRSDPGESVIHGAPWGSRPDGVYAYPYSSIPIGSMLQVTDANGKMHDLEVVGFFENGEQAAWPGMNDQFLVSEELGKELGIASNSQFYLAVKPSELDNTAETLGRALPQVTLLNMPDFQARLVRQYENLFAFVAVMAGLSILAGILLVANSVSLAMLERRFEISVLKSIGYSRSQVLFSQVVEYTLMSVVVTLAGLTLIWGVLGLAGLANNVLASLLVLKPSTAGIIALVTIGLTALTVLWATWKPGNVSPVFVLNDRE